MHNYSSKVLSWSGRWRRQAIGSAEARGREAALCSLGFLSLAAAQPTSSISLHLTCTRALLRHSIIQLAHTCIVNAGGRASRRASERAGCRATWAKLKPTMLLRPGCLVGQAARAGCAAGQLGETRRPTNSNLGERLALAGERSKLKGRKSLPKSFPALGGCSRLRPINGKFEWAQLLRVPPLASLVAGAVRVSRPCVKLEVGNLLHAPQDEWHTGKRIAEVTTVLDRMLFGFVEWNEH